MQSYLEKFENVVRNLFRIKSKTRDKVQNFFNVICKTVKATTFKNLIVEIINPLPPLILVSCRRKIFEQVLATECRSNFSNKRVHAVKEEPYKL